MTHIVLSAEATVAAPADAVWAVLADYARDPQWRRGVRSMVPTPAGPVRTGTTTREVLRAAGRTTHNDGVVTEVVPGRRFAWRTTAGVEAEGTRDVEPLPGDACRVRLELRVRPPGLLRLATGPLRRLLVHGLRGDLTRLRALVEAGPGQEARTKNSSALPSGSLNDRARP